MSIVIRTILILLLPLLLIVTATVISNDNNNKNSDNGRRNLIANENDDDDYPVITHCDVHENLFHQNNSMMHDFDTIEANPLLSSSIDDIDSNKNNTADGEEKEVDYNALLKVEFLAHAKEEHANAMTRDQNEFTKCAVDVSKTHECH